MIVRKLRLQRGWSQEQLAEMSGLSVRTIQRIERGRPAGLESLKSLAAVFETDVSNLTTEPDMPEPEALTRDERRAIEHVRDIKGFYSHLIAYLIFMPLLIFYNLFVDPKYIWIVWTGMGWGAGVTAHGLAVFEVFRFFGPDWERRQVEEILKRQL